MDKNVPKIYPKKYIENIAINIKDYGYKWNTIVKINTILSDLAINKYMGWDILAIGRSIVNLTNASKRNICKYL